MKGILMFIGWILLVSLVLGGCSGTAALVDALAKDPAANCIVVSSPYGGLLVARATPGVKVQLAGGTCSIEAAPVK